MNTPIAIKTFERFSAELDAIKEKINQYSREIEKVFEQDQSVDQTRLGFYRAQLGEYKVLQTEIMDRLDKFSAREMKLAVAFAKSNRESKFLANTRSFTD